MLYTLGSNKMNMLREKAVVFDNYISAYFSLNEKLNNYFYLDYIQSRLPYYWEGEDIKFKIKFTTTKTIGRVYHTVLYDETSKNYMKVIDNLEVLPVGASVVFDISAKVIPSEIIELLENTNVPNEIKHQEFSELFNDELLWKLKCNLEYKIPED